MLSGLSRSFDDANLGISTRLIGKFGLVAAEMTSLKFLYESPAALRIRASLRRLLQFFTA